MKNKKTKRPKYYMTKRVKQQYLYWRILIATAMVAICILGASHQYTIRYIDRLQQHAPTSLNIITPAKAVESFTEPVPEPLQPTQPTQPKEDIRSLILRIAQEEQFKWPDYLVRLANCESRLNPQAVNKQNNNPHYSTDRGLFQINDYYHPTISDEQAFNPEFATRWTINQINNGNQHYWVCDKYIRANPEKYR